VRDEEPEQDKERESQILQQRVKQQALIRAERDGAVVAAKELGLKPERIYAWCS